MQGELPRRRRWFVYGVAAIVVGGALRDVVTSTEHWPFSPYAMYSEVRLEPEVRLTQLYGVTGERPPREVVVRALPPLDQSQVWIVFAHLVRWPTRRDRLAPALAWALERHETLRRRGRVPGPPLTRMRVYESTWTLDPWARNVDRPERRALIAEAALP